MSHTIYNTDAVVLHRVATGEADITLWLLTAELGLLVAKAQGARKGTAKMRTHLQLFSLLRISLVRGKYVWRVTGAEQVVNVPGVPWNILQGETLSAFARIATFVRRMMLTDSFVDSESVLELFEIVQAARFNLIGISNSDQEGKTPKQGFGVDEVELRTVAQILISLGYVGTEIVSKIEKSEISQNELARVVNNAIAESHL